MTLQRWEFSTTQPPDWGSLIERTGGGFYHSPPGLLLNAATGQPLYCTLYDENDDVVGIALGEERRCRLSRQPRHLHFPSVPALGGLPDPEGALAALLARLQRRGAADVTMLTYDAPWTPRPERFPLAGTLRQEYVVHLDAGPDELLRSFNNTHRRYCSRGAREGWELRLLHGATAVAALREVMDTTASRARSRGRDYSITIPIEAAIEAGDDAPRAGRALTFAAYHDDTLLGAALIGVAGRRSYLVIGGSTEEGYRKYSTAWLYWRIMAWLHEHGVTTYNLGGSPGSPLTASNPDDPNYGLHFFKMGFGPMIVRSHCGRWELGQNHLRLHRLLTRLAAPIGR